MIPIMLITIAMTIMAKIDVSQLYEEKSLVLHPCDFIFFGVVSDALIPIKKIACSIIVTSA